MNIRTTGKEYISSLGVLYSVNLKDNNIGSLRSEFNKLLGQKVTLDDNNEEVVIKGIEAFATHDAYNHQFIGILIKSNT